jgi:hypothetical protein
MSSMRGTPAGCEMRTARAAHPGRTAAKEGTFLSSETWPQPAARQLQPWETGRSCARHGARPAAAAPPAAPPPSHARRARRAAGALTAAWAVALAYPAPNPIVRQGRQRQPGRAGEPVHRAEPAARPRAGRVGPGGPLRAAARAAAHIQRRRCARADFRVQDRVGLGHRVAIEPGRRAAPWLCCRGHAPEAPPSQATGQPVISCLFEATKRRVPRAVLKTRSPAFVAGLRLVGWPVATVLLGMPAGPVRSTRALLAVLTGRHWRTSPAPDKDGSPCVRDRARARAGNDLCGAIPAGVPAMTSANASIAGFAPCPGCAPTALPALTCRPESVCRSSGKAKAGRRRRVRCDAAPVASEGAACLACSLLRY